MSPRAVRARAIVCAFMPALGLLAGCSNVEPWVKPYERQNFADLIMSAARDPVSQNYIEHVYEAREGSRGAIGSAGGGCGCN